MSRDYIRGEYSILSSCGRGSGNDAIVDVLLAVAPIVVSPDMQMAGAEYYERLEQKQEQAGEEVKKER
jgi:hypothetical protein